MKIHSSGYRMYWEQRVSFPMNHGDWWDHGGVFYIRYRNDDSSDTVDKGDGDYTSEQTKSETGKELKIQEFKMEKRKPLLHKWRLPSESVEPIEALRPESAELRKAYWKLEAAREVVKVCDENPQLDVLGTKGIIPHETTVTDGTKEGCSTSDTVTDDSSDTVDKGDGDYTSEQTKSETGKELKIQESKLGKRKSLLRRLSSPFRKFKKSLF
ncbi:hypothetical protein ScPMuIL_017668 [Solemya velum]